MKHAYVMTEDMDEIQAAHDELVEHGVDDKHIHVLSDSEADLQKRHLRSVNPFMKTDLLRSMMIGAVIGTVLALCILSLPYIFGLSTPAGNIPFIFAAMLVFGFCTWEGGLWGIQSINKKFEKVDEQVHQGQHMMIVDYDENEAVEIESMKRHHPKLTAVDI